MPIFDNLKQSFDELTKLNFHANFSEIFSHPTTVLTLIGVLILVSVLLAIKKVKLTTNMITHIAIVLALSTVLDYFKIYRLPQGGDITFGSMIPIILIALWYGPEIGFITGLLFGIISLILGPYILYPAQVLFDYPLPFLMLGTAGFFKKNKYVACIVAVFLRYVCHVISGVLFFASYAPKGQSPLVYSIIYNGTYISIDLIICLVILAVLPIKQLEKVILKNKINIQ
jgi:putative proton-coupled thiamine transporter YuaJ